MITWPAMIEPKTRYSNSFGPLAKAAQSASVKVKQEKRESVVPVTSLTHTHTHTHPRARIRFNHALIENQFNLLSYTVG